MALTISRVEALEGIELVDGIGHAVRQLAHNGMNKLRAVNEVKVAIGHTPGAGDPVPNAQVHIHTAHPERRNTVEEHMSGFNNQFFLILIPNHRAEVDLLQIFLFCQNIRKPLGLYILIAQDLHFIV